MSSTPSALALLAMVGLPVILGSVAADRAPRGARAVLSNMDVRPLQAVLGTLRGMESAYHTLHWQVGGPNFYGDHLLLQRLYEAGGNPDIIKEIDSLGEKMVAYAGPESVRGEVIWGLATNTTSEILRRAGKTPSPETVIGAMLRTEELLQEQIRFAYQTLKDRGQLSLGLDDFLMALADERDGAIYLLRQRLAGRGEAS